MKLKWNNFDSQKKCIIDLRKVLITNGNAVHLPLISLTLLSLRAELFAPFQGFDVDSPTPQSLPACDHIYAS